MSPAASWSDLARPSKSIDGQIPCSAFSIRLHEKFMHGIKVLMAKNFILTSY